MMWMFDVETLGIESSSVILSFAIIPWTYEEEYTYEQYLNRSLFVKFDVKEQMKSLKRTSDASSLEFWKAQGERPRIKSFIPHPDDVSAEVGLSKLERFVKDKDDGGKQYAWARGGLDQVTLDSLTRAVRGPDANPIFAYNNWFDVRTAIAFTKDSAGGGYCQVPDFDRSVVVKHDPVHDCAYDILMLKYGK